MHVCIDLFIRYVRIDGFMRIYVQIIFEAPGARERKLAGRGLGRGNAWKGSLNGSQHSHHGGRAHDETFALHALSEGDQNNPNGMVAGKPQNCAFYSGFMAL